MWVIVSHVITQTCNYVIIPTEVFSDFNPASFAHFPESVNILMCHSHSQFHSLFITNTHRTCSESYMCYKSFFPSLEKEAVNTWVTMYVLNYFPVIFFKHLMCFFHIRLMFTVILMQHCISQFQSIRHMVIKVAKMLLDIKNWYFLSYYCTVVMINTGLLLVLPFTALLCLLFFFILLFLVIYRTANALEVYHNSFLPHWKILKITKQQHHDYQYIT